MFNVWNNADKFRNIFIHGLKKKAKSNQKRRMIHGNDTSRIALVLGWVTRRLAIFERRSFNLEILSSDGVSTAP